MLKEGGTEVNKFGDQLRSQANSKGKGDFADLSRIYGKGDQSCFTTNQLTLLRQRVAGLPSGDIQAYFRGVREIVAEIKAKAVVCEERILYLKHDLPYKMAQVKKLRCEIVEEKNKAFSVLQEFETTQNLVMRTLRDEAPDLFSKLNQYSSLKSELQLLLFTQNFLEAKKRLKVALAESDISSIRTALAALQRQPDFFMKPDETEIFLMQRQKLADEAEKFISKKIGQILKDLHYPFDSDYDYHTLESRISVLVDALKCHSDILSYNGSLVDSLATLSFLFEPFVQRFEFHFFKDRKTNVNNKPEWFFNLLLLWLTANMPFLDKLTHLLFPSEESVMDALRAFQTLLLNLGKRKMKEILDKIADEKVLFSHLIDEAILFEKDVKEGGLLLTPISVLDVLCEEPFLGKWLDLEMDSCRNSVEIFLSSDARWKQRYREIADTDRFRVPECTDHFILLLDSITERYRWITDLKIQAKFFGIQVLMLEEFHLRLVQISQQLSTPWEEPFMQILNSFWYISCVMEEWADADVFLRVQMHNAGSRVRGIFVEIAEIYKHVWRQRATDMCDAFSQHIRSQLTKYKSVKWFAIELSKPTDLTPSFCPFFLEVRRLLGRVASAISPDSAVAVFRMLNVKIAEVLLEVINGTSFNCNGASQMLFDVTSCLLPVLNSIFGESPTRLEALDEPLFQEVIVSLRLLSLPVASVILLRNELKQSPEEMASTLLANYSASMLERDRVLALFNQRCDIELDFGISVNL